ncbi:MAG: nuclear transport factor 2 family protein [Acidimicrobiaceae bacterium]|nr:nuclear transport factor 2 family protein [Acidimicrobiaceae bacterium]
MAHDDDLEGRVRALEDMVEIQQLVNNYGRLLDRGDFAAYAELFATDGEVLLGPVARAAGRDEVRKAMEAAVPAPYGNSFHIIGTPIVTLDGDTASSEVMWTVINRGADGRPVVGMIGRHKDDLVREDGRWRFKRRKGFVDIPSTMPGS